MNYKLFREYFVTTAVLLFSMTSVMPQDIRSTEDSKPAKKGFSDFSTPQNLGGGINSASIDEHPIIAPSGLSLYFASDRPGGLGGRDIYVSQRATLSSAWGAAQNVVALNTSGNEVGGSISPDGFEMFMNSPRPGGVGGVDLWISTRTNPNDDLGWTTPVNLGPVINSTLADQNPNYFVDPETGDGTLFFTSDRSSGTAGVKDIYQSTRNSDGTFNPPAIVAELNSTADDARTAISSDGLEIFISSTRLGPSTTQAIFVSSRRKTSKNWEEPVYVAELNTSGSNAQPALSPDGTILYFVSNRSGGFGTGDIYSATRVGVKKCGDNKFEDNDN